MATLMAPLHSSSSRSSLTFVGVGSPAGITSTERPWADPPQPAISSPVQQSSIHQEQHSQRSSGGGQILHHVAVRWFRRGLDT